MDIKHETEEIDDFMNLQGMNNIANKRPYSPGILTPSAEQDLSSHFEVEAKLKIKTEAELLGYSQNGENSPENGPRSTIKREVDSSSGKFPVDNQVEVKLKIKTEAELLGYSQNGENLPENGPRSTIKREVDSCSGKFPVDDWERMDGEAAAKRIKIAECIIDTEETSTGDENDNFNITVCDLKIVYPPITLIDNPITSITEETLESIESEDETPENHPIKFFDRLADSAFYSLITGHTNDYSVELLSQSSSEKCRIAQWKDVTEREFRIWLGIVFHMGVIKIHKLSEYWRKHNLFNLRIFSRYMSYSRFTLILKALRFDGSVDKRLSISKIAPLVEYFNLKMDEVFNRDTELTGQESIVLWRSSVDYTNAGFKLYMLGDSNGIALKIMRHQETNGKYHKNKTITNEKSINEAKKQLSDVIKTRTGIKNVETDSKYNVRVLKQQIINEKLIEKGSSVVSDGVDALDINEAREQSEKCIVTSQEIVDLPLGINESKRMVSSPRLIIEYNKCNGTIVDYHSIMMKYYPCQTRSMCWYIKLGIHLFETILLNSFYLYKRQCDAGMDLYDFRLCVIEKLLGPVSKDTREVNEGDRHYLDYRPEGSNGHKKRKRCKYCWTMNKKRKDSIFYCPDCEGSPGFCISPCFKLYHEGRK